MLRRPVLGAADRDIAKCRDHERRPSTGLRNIRYRDSQGTEFLERGLGQSPTSMSGHDIRITHSAFLAISRGEASISSGSTG